MAWVRRVRTASGATAVQIAESVAGRRRIVAHLGSAHSEAELGVLVEQARAMLADTDQTELDLGLVPTARGVRLVKPVADAALLPEPAPAAQSPPVAGPRVMGTCSRLLFEVLAGVFTDLGFEVIADEVFRDLVIARVVEPTSILDTPRVLGDLGQDPVSTKTMRRTLARAQQHGYRDQIAAACFAHAVSGGDVSLCLYDVTTLYFEADDEDELRKVGYSKERRVDPQIVVGLLVDRTGFPLEIGCFEGNKAETTTLIPIIEQFQERHGLSDMVVVADAGMLSAANLQKLDAAGFRFIVGSRVTKAPVDLESHFRWHGDAFEDGQIIDTLTAKNRRALENDPNLLAEPVWDPDQHPGSWRAVWAYSAKRATRDRATLTAQENKAKAVIAGEKTARTPRFVKTRNGDTFLDETSLARARALVGLKGYATNIPATVMPAGEVIGSYHNLWQVEQSFRMSKTDLRARPMFVRTRDAIEAHLTIVFTALAVARTAQSRSGLAIRNVIRQLRPLRSATIAINGHQQLFPPDVPPSNKLSSTPSPTGPAGTKAIDQTQEEFSVLATRMVPDLALWGSSSGQFFPRYTWVPIEEGTLEVGDDVIDGYLRVDNITDEILAQLHSLYGQSVTKDDVFFFVYGLLHAPDYRQRYAGELKQMLPRIPNVSDTAFHELVAAGRELANLHMDYEDVEPYPLKIDGGDQLPIGDEANIYRVEKMRFPSGHKAADTPSRIILNPNITVEGIPEEAYRYQLGSRSAIEWIMRQYQVNTDKPSGTVNDPNQWGTEHGNPRYVLDLLEKVVTASVRTTQIVEGLPQLG